MRKGLFNKYIIYLGHGGCAASHYFLIIIISSTIRRPEGDVPKSLNFDKSSFKTLFNFNWFLKTSIIKFWENLIFKTKFLLIITSFLMAAEHALVIKTIYSYCYFVYP